MLYLHMGKKVKIVSFSQQNFSMIVLSLHKSHFSYWADAGITIISALISFSGWKEWTKKSGGKRQLEVEYFYFPQSETQRNIMSLREQERGKHTLSGLQMAKLLADSLPHQFILETVKLLYQNSTHLLFGAWICITQASIECERVHLGELLFLALLLRK